MENIDMKTYARPWDKNRYPEIIKLVMATERLTQIKRRLRCQRNVNMLGFELSGFGEITVHVACISAEVGRWLRDHCS